MSNIMTWIGDAIGRSGGLLNVALALGAVLVAIVLVVWLLKVLTNATGNIGRGRNRRLAVVDTLALDPKRQLVIIRRDDVEHLILTGGPQDVVIETGIAVEEEAPAQPSRRPIPMVAARKAPAAKPAPAPAPVPTVTINEPGTATTAMERLRELGQPADKKAHLSLRHTGLLRPVSEGEIAVSPEKSGAPAAANADSAKEDQAKRQVEGSQLEDNEANRG
jgi:flagellar protein FliO/FliZ